jgi:hypothetical protein
MFRERKYPLHLLGIEWKFISCPSSSLVAIPPELSQLSSYMYNYSFIRNAVVGVSVIRFMLISLSSAHFSKVIELISEVGAPLRQILVPPAEGTSG